MRGTHIVQRPVQLQRPQLLQLVVVQAQVLVIEFAIEFLPDSACYVRVKTAVYGKISVKLDMIASCLYAEQALPTPFHGKGNHQVIKLSNP